MFLDGGNHQVNLNKRHCGGGSLIVWGMIFGVWSHFCQNGIWSNNFRRLYQAYGRHCLPFNERPSPQWFRTATRQCFEDTGIEFLPWPSRSPDLNIIGNVWRLLSSRVENKKELKETVFEAVDHMNSHVSEYVKTLFSLLHSRFLSCVTRNGNNVSY